MRNLKNVRLSEVKLIGHLPLTATAWDPVTDDIICAFGPSEGHQILDIRRKKRNGALDSFVDSEALQSIASWDAPCPLPDLTCDRILSLQYFADSLTVVLVLEGGDIILVREDDQPGEDKIEIVGSVEVGITAAAWAPDEELLVITTRADTLLYMTREFENVADVTLTPDDLKASRHVSVGWGKKETQFQGKRAKALRDPTMPEKVDEGLPSKYEDKRTTISWRGDGAFVAINSAGPGDRRTIRVYSREGALDSVSEPVDGLEGALSWRPVGNLISGVQRLEDRIDVVFFERNGLRHGQFTLRLTEEERQSWAANISLAWNIDSTVLAVQFYDRVQLWTMGNYHYYLKQEIALAPIEGCRSLSLRWHHEKAMRSVFSTSDTILDTDWAFDIAGGSARSPTDFGAVAVVDGRILKLTPLRLHGVPPPMAHCEISVDTNIIDAAFSQSGSQIAVLTAQGITIFQWSLKSKPVQIPKLKSTHLFSDSESSRARQVVFLNENEVYVLRQNELLESVVEKTDVNSNDTVVVHQTTCAEPIHSIFSNVELNKLWLSQKGRNGRSVSFFRISDSNFSENAWEEAPPTETFFGRAGQLPTDEEILFTMARTGALYANGRLLARNCTSFLVTPAHLIYTTTQHLLKFIHITKVEDMEVPGDTPEADERCRSIERGGRLVTVMPSNFSLVLQMPRGNIETIFPRALVLAGIRYFIEQKNYRKAFLACRSQMVDMNILHDYAPAQFMSCVQLFVEQVKKIEFIDEFLSRLRDEDVCETLYKDTLKIAKSEAEVQQPSAPALGPAGAPNGGGKVNRICSAFLDVLKDRIDSNLQNIVTAHVCKTPPDLEAGLQLVARLRKQSSEQAEEAIEHMCFLTDANRLYDNALGLYDLELTLLVAQQAQKDPREYLPFLQNLQELPELRRRHDIDNHLGRYSKALRSLHELQTYDELKRYAIKHTLYQNALDLCKYQPEQLRDMTEAYADYLRDQSKFKDAAVAYESLSLYESAYKCYQLAHLWRESLYCATLVPLAEAELAEHAQNLATTLTDESRDYISAAQIYSQHLNDIPAAARLLCRGYAFADACRVLALHFPPSQSQTFIADIVDSGLADAMGSTTDLLADCRSQLEAQVPRIRELRARRAADPLAFFGGDPTTGEGADIPDNISLAPTDVSTMAGRTVFTRYTGNTANTGSSRRTSKTRRREERKRARGKKGTVYEEEYLVNSVRRLVEKVNGEIPDIEALIQGLLRRSMRERAAAVEKGLDELLERCRGCLEEVFETEQQQKPQDQENGVEGEGGLRPPGGGGVLWDSLEERGKSREPPVVKSFKKLALLSG